MKIVAIQHEEILEHIVGSLNEQGLLPVFDVEKIIKQEEIISILQKSFQTSDKLVILGGDNTCLKAFSNVGIISFDAVCSSEKQSVVSPSNIILVGVRQYGAKDKDACKKIKVYPMKEIIEEGIHETAESVMAAARHFGTLYVSINLNVLDPAFAPGCLNPVPAGLSARELLFFLNRFKNLKNLRILDIVGLKKDADEMTLQLAAKIITEFY
jgi:hypothetical protein